MMADPLSIVGAVGSVAGIIDVLTRSISAIATLRSQYKDADLLFMNLTSQLGVLRTGLVKIAEWAETEPEPHYQLKMDLDSVILCCQILASKLDSHLESLHQGRVRLSSLGKLKLALNGPNIDAIQKMLGQQTATLTLLLAACNTKSLSEQRELLEAPTTRTAIAAMEQDSASLIVHEDRTSICTVETDTMSRLSAIFPFDNQLLTTKVYGRAWRTTFLNRGPKTSRRTLSEATTILPTEKRMMTVPMQLEHSRRNSTSNIPVNPPLPTNSKVKILLLGTGGSGKTTLLKQMQNVWGGQSQMPTLEDRICARRDIVQELCHFFFALLFGQEEAVAKTVCGTWKRMDTLKDAIALYEMDNFAYCDDSIFSDRVVPLIREIWADESWRARAMKRPKKKRSKPQASFDVAYFMLHIDRISDKNYMPTEQDIFHFSPVVQTLGVSDYVFQVGNIQYCVHDVGGSRPERRKWIHVREDADIVLWQSPIGAYDEGIREDNTAINMNESLTLFESVVNSRWFNDASFFVNFTKMDLFEQKITSGQSPLADFHPNYHGDPGDVKAGVRFFIDEFRAKVKEHAGSVHMTVLDTTDTAQATLLLQRVVQVAEARSMRRFSFI
ncbi:putative guanine nucleotide-binding protein alpha-2 subunit [Cercophora samala]|uniref:Guanine nucleotide-binding protein alpha-2 subunit n=1 Tax=Cercophora samala TaxID=330535 RepID=A0AA39Z6N3_9PEZI|nr:putative guanine nucleotide-binding protein alpha-2 subunit [Cercophora samala]